MEGGRREGTKARQQNWKCLHQVTVMSVGLWEVGLRCCGCGVLLRVTRGASVVSEVCVCVFGVLSVCCVTEQYLVSDTNISPLKEEAYICTVYSGF